MNAALRDELLAMAEQDQRVRAELAADGSLSDGYDPTMQAVHAGLVAGQDREPVGRQLGERLFKAWVVEQHGSLRSELPVLATQYCRPAPHLPQVLDW